MLLVALFSIVLSAQTTAQWVAVPSLLFNLRLVLKLLKLLLIPGHLLKVGDFGPCSIPSSPLSPSEDHQATTTYRFGGVAVG